MSEKRNKATCASVFMHIHVYMQANEPAIAFWRPWTDQDSGEEGYYKVLVVRRQIARNQLTIKFLESGQIVRNYDCDLIFFEEELTHVQTFL